MRRMCDTCFIDAMEEEEDEGVFCLFDAKEKCESSKAKAKAMKI